MKLVQEKISGTMNSQMYSYVYLLLWTQHVFSGIPSIKLKPAHHYIEQEESTEYNFIAGGKLILPCDITPPSPDDRVVLMLWYQGTSGYPVFSVDARYRESIALAEHTLLENHASRITLNITERKAFLVIEPVKEEDAGEYRCRLDYLRGRTVRRSHMVNIIVPTRDVHIRHGDHVYVHGSIGPVVEGSFLNLTCEAVGGKPPPDVTWWRRSTLLDNTDWRISNEIVANTYTIPYVYRNYSRTALTCNASNNEYYPPASVTITLDLNLRPQYVRITSPRNSLRAGRQVEIVCQTKGSFPPAEVSWWIEGEKLKRFQKSLTDSTGLTTSRVTLTPRGDDNGKNLTCRAENPRSSEIALEDSRKLDVLYKPKLSLTLRTSNQNHGIREGTGIYLDCKVNANPQLRDLQWKVDGRILTSNPTNGIEIRGQSLKLKNVTQALRGRYHCTAKNIVGISRSNNISLVILPIVRPEPVQNCSVENLTQKSLTVVCAVGVTVGVTEYHLSVYTKNGHKLLVNSTSFDLPLFVISDLPDETFLKIFIYASNSKRNSTAVVLEARTLSSVEEHTRGIHHSTFILSPLLATLFGIIVILFTSTVIVLFITKQRSYRIQKGIATSSCDDHKPSGQKTTFSGQHEKCPDVILPRSPPLVTQFAGLVMSVGTNMADVDNQRICEDLRTDKEQNYRSRKSKKLLFLNLTQKETSCYESSISATVPDMLRGSNIIKRNHNLQSLETERGSCVYSLETPLMDSIENDQKWEKLERKSPSLSTAV